jgi:hypothetical protein
MTPCYLGRTKLIGRLARGSGWHIACSDAMDHSTEGSVELAPVVLFL